MELTDQPIETLAPLLRKRKVSPVELTRAFLERIARLNPTLNAFITVTAERAMADARRAEGEIKRGKYRGPLHGIPITLKDNIATAGIRTTGGSRILAFDVPEQDATIARQLREAGTVLLGKTNLHEFAYGVTTENPHYGPARNPWDTARIPGGSSGGSAAAIASGMCCTSIGTDTGGSVRIPSALCGIVGLKTTYDPSSLKGIIPLSISLDSVGPLARTVGDAAILVRATVPFTGRDSKSVRAARKGMLAMPQADSAKGKKPLRGVVLGIPQDYFNLWIDTEVRRAVEWAIADCVRLGAQLEEVGMPWMGQSDDAGTQIALAEASQWHASQGWYPARAADYGDDVRKRLEMGAKIGEAEITAAHRAQNDLTRAMWQVFETIHALAVPTTPAVASLVGETMVNICGRAEPVRGALLRLNRPANFIGLPAISVPCGFTRKGLPIGLQLIGQPCGELDLCAIARAYEQMHEWRLRRPAL